MSPPELPDFLQVETSLVCVSVLPQTPGYPPGDRPKGNELSRPHAAMPLWPDPYGLIPGQFLPAKKNTLPAFPPHPDGYVVSPAPSEQNRIHPEKSCKPLRPVPFFPMSVHATFPLHPYTFRQESDCTCALPLPSRTACALAEVLVHLPLQISFHPRRTR